MDHDRTAAFDWFQKEAGNMDHQDGKDWKRDGDVTFVTSIGPSYCRSVAAAIVKLNVLHRMQSNRTVQPLRSRHVFWRNPISESE